MAKFPYRDSDTRALEKGEQVARARYYQDLRSTAKEILDDLKDDDGEVDRDKLDERIHEEADSAVIYTKTALDILVESSNWTAIDEVGEIPDDASQAVTVMAYYAYRQDLTEAVERESDDMSIELNPSRRSRTKKKSARGRKSTSKKTNPRRSSSTRYEGFDVSELEAMPTLSTGQAHDLKYDNGRVRYWLSRMTAADGETAAVHVEELRGGRWVDVHQYGRPARNPAKRGKKKTSRRKAPRKRN